MGQFDGRSVLITGGESGIGLTTARRFVDEGAGVHIVGIDEAKLKEAQNTLGAQVSIATADVTKESAVAEAVQAGVARWGGFDTVFSNAGIAGPIGRPFAELESADVQQVLAVHVIGAFHLLKHVSPHVRDGGSIVIMSSVAGLTGFSGAAPYVAAKHALVGVMRSAADEFAPRRIRVNTIHPGATSTAFQDDIETRFTGQDKASANKVFDDMVPFGRHCTTDEVADAVLFLASDASRMISRVTLPIDGGLTA